MAGGDSWGISVTGETPQVAIATEEAHRTPPGKRPPAMEINSPLSPAALPLKDAIHNQNLQSHNNKSSINLSSLYSPTLILSRHTYHSHFES
jgi:hypothetical protein